MSGAVPTMRDLRRRANKVRTSQEEIIALESWADRTRLSIETCLRIEEFEEAQKLGEQVEQCNACIAILKQNENFG